MKITSLSNDIRKFVDNELLDFYLSEMKRLISEGVISEDIIYEALDRVMSRDGDEEYKNILDLFFIKPSNMFSVEGIIIMDDSDCRISRTIEQVYYDEKIKFKIIYLFFSFFMDTNKIALYLSGKLAPYYGSSNLYHFYKKLQEFSPEQFTKEEMIFIQQLEKNDDERIYYAIIDHIDKSIKNYCNTYDLKNKNDIFKFLMELGVPESLIFP